MNFSFNHLQFDLVIEDENHWKDLIVRLKINKDFKQLMRSCSMAMHEFLTREFSHKEFIVSINYARGNVIRSLNHEYRNKDKDTDVLSFPLHEPFSETIQSLPQGFPIHLGDIYISIDQAFKQSKELGVDLFSELVHLQIHGFLHLLGYDHELSAQDEAEMEELEKKLVLSTQNIYSRI